MNFNEALIKARELISKMTVEEKVSQLVFNSPEIERLSINEYNWWNEAAHGVARAGMATVFPQAIGLAATFNDELVFTVADAVSTEGRAKYNQSVKFGDRGIYKGLTYWTPNINIFRDPRWGRGQETYGEDPFLTATLGSNYIKGLQGDGEFLKTAACAKHFAVHSGPEKLRHEFNAKVSKKDLWETYLPAFYFAVKEGVAGVMGAYNRTNDEACCASPTLIGDILREKWGFSGYFVSDCEAVLDIYKNHKMVDSIKEAAAVAIKNGCNLNCGKAFSHLYEAYEEDLITEDDIDAALERVFATRFMLGEFEDERPFKDIPFSVVDSEEHRTLNLKAASQSLVLLENKSSFLPIDKEKELKIAIIGPNSNSRIALEGNYNGHASEYVTISEGVRRVFKNSTVKTFDGSFIYKEGDEIDGFVDLQFEAAAASAESDITILCLGYDRTVEGEEIDVEDEIFCGGDRKSLYLPKVQRELASLVSKNAKKLIVVVMSGSAVDIGDELREKADAVIHAWYPGALGGLAVAGLIAGDFSPSGKLPLTFYKGEDTLPDFCDYSMDNRTYRYIETEPLYPFGYGLSFSEVVYSDFSLVSENEKEYIFKVKLANKGNYETTEKVQIYVKMSDSRTKTPLFQLCGIKAVPLLKDEEKYVEIKVNRYWTQAVNSEGERIEPDGNKVFYIGSHAPDKKSSELLKNECLKLNK